MLLVKKTFGALSAARPVRSALFVLAAALSPAAAGAWPTWMRLPEQVSTYAPRIDDMEVARAEAIEVSPSAAADRLELTKPRITGLVLVTAAVGYAVGTGASFELPRFLLFMLLSRDIAGEEKLEEMEPEDARLAGQALPKGSRLWAKSGDAYDFHHLVGRVALPNGSDFVIAVFTKGVKTVPDVIPSVYGKVAAHFMALATVCYR